MREGLKLSSMIFLCGVMILFQESTQMKIDFISLVALTLCISLWCDLQLKKPLFRLVHLSAVIGLVLYTVLGVGPISTAVGVEPVNSALFFIDHTLFAKMGASSFVGELYAYIVDVNKLEFYRWDYLWIVFLLVLSEGLYWVLRKDKMGILLLIALVGSALLWFTYLEVWVIFSCVFIAYAIERLTRNGKGILFGLVLPLSVALCALLATNLTPVEEINEWFAPLTSETGWLRTSLNLSPSTGGFQLREMGFYPLENRLGGPVKLSKEIIFRVKSAKPKIYLRGRVLTHYENNLWTVVEKEPTGFYPVSGKLTDTFSYQIYDFKSKTSSVLVPMTVSSIDIPTENLKYGKDGEVLYQGNLKADFKDGFNISGYEFSYLTPKNPEEYLQLPEVYSKKVISLTQEVIKGAKTDEEKIKLIRKYLINNYQYALAVSVTPEDQDFVEYFLMESDAGYCVYFATATAVMSRIAGVPSRYVEGFVTPEIYEAGRDFPVSGERAHAWAEVYYDRKWQIVESTPTFTSRTSFDTEDPRLKSDLLAAEPEDLPNKEEQDLEVDIPEETATAQSMSPFWWVGFIAAFAIFSALMIQYGKFKAFFKGSANEVAKKYVALLLLGLVKRFGLSNSENLSPREILRLSDRSAPSLNLMHLVEIVEKSLYDSKEINEIELERLTQSYWQLSRSHFSGTEKLYWYVRIAGKGRIFNGYVRKNSTS